MPIVEIIEDIWANQDRLYNIRRLVNRLQRIEKEMSGEAREMFSAHIPAGDVGKYRQRSPPQVDRNFVDTMNLLRNKVFQDLLTNYPRKERQVHRHLETQDTVTSSWLVRGIDGKEYKPDDYLIAFSQFVRENPQQIEAIRILLQRPKDWNTKALSDFFNKSWRQHPALQQGEPAKSAPIALPKGARGYYFYGQARRQ